MQFLMCGWNNRFFIQFLKLLNGWCRNKYIVYFIMIISAMELVFGESKELSNIETIQWQTKSIIVPKDFKIWPMGKILKFQKLND